MSIRQKRHRTEKSNHHKSVHSTSPPNTDHPIKRKKTPLSSSGKSNWKKLLKNSNISSSSSLVYKNKKPTNPMPNTSPSPSHHNPEVQSQPESTDKNINPDQTVALSSIKGSHTSPVRRSNKKPTLTKYLSMDCEMVGVGSDGKRSMLARVCLVNTFGDVVYDKYCLPTEPVTDYRTWVSGIEPKHILPHLSTTAIPFKDIQADVLKYLKGRILVGHGLVNDLRCLLISHPFSMIRDTARYRKLQWAKGKPRSLKNLVKHHLGLDIQNEEHDPAIDAWCSYLLYRNFRQEWEQKMKKPKPKSKKNKSQNTAQLTLTD